MRKIKEIPNIKKIVVGENIYFESITKNILDSKLHKINFENLISFYLYDYNNQVFINDENSNSIYKVKKDKIDLIPFKGYRIYSFDEKSYLVFSQTQNSTTISLYLSNELIWTNVRLGYNVCFNNKYYVYKPAYKSNIVEVRKMKDFSFAFSFDIGIDCTVGRTLLIQEDILIVPFIKEKPDREVYMVGIDLITRKELWRTKSDVHEFISDKNTVMLYAIYSSSTEQKISLQTLNPTDGQINTSIINHNYRGDIMPWNASISNDKLFYSDNVENGKIGIVDLLKNEIISEYEIGLDLGVKISKPVIFKNKLYVLDTMNILHIFELTD